MFLTFKQTFYSHWEQFTHPKYGNCFIFNSGLNASKEVKKGIKLSKNLIKLKVRQVTVTGSSNGLVLELYLDQTNYMYNKLSKAAGARVNIHDP